LRKWHRVPDLNILISVYLIVKVDWLAFFIKRVAFVQREKPAGEEVVDEVDMDMAAMMGFGGFGTSKK
jgi:hypothetical protein